MSGADTVDVHDFGGEPHVLASDVVHNYTSWLDARRVAEARWKETYDYCNATSTRDTSNVQNDWDNSTNLPKMAQIADNLEANYEPALFPHNEWFRFDPHTAEAASIELRRKLESYIYTKNRLNNFFLEIKKCIRDWIYSGNCFAEVEYVTEKRYNPLTEQEEVIYTGPKVCRISPYDIVFNPLATNFDNAPKIVRKIFTVAEIKKLAEKGVDWAVEAFPKVSKLRHTARSIGDKETNKHLSLEYDGYGNVSQYLRSGYVEVLTMYGDIYDFDNDELRCDYKIVVVDRMWVAEQGPIMTPSGKPHIFHCGWRIRPDNLWAQGPLELLVGMQYRINHLENAKADAWDQQLDSDLVLVGNVEERNDGARTLYIIDDGQGSVNRLAPDIGILQGNNAEIASYMALMEEIAGAPKQAMGIRTPGEKTAFEVSTLDQGAARVFQNKTSYYERTFLERILNAELEVARDNIAAVDTIPVVGDDDGVMDFLEVTPADLRSVGKLVPQGARHFARQAQLMQNLSQIQQVLADPAVNVHVSGKKMAEVVINDVMNYSKFELFQPYVRIAEQMEAQQLQVAAEDELAFQQQAEAEGLGDEEIAPDGEQGPF